MTATTTHQTLHHRAWRRHGRQETVAEAEERWLGDGGYGGEPLRRGPCRLPAIGRRHARTRRGEIS